MKLRTKVLDKRQFDILIVKAKNGCLKSRDRIIISFLPYIIKRIKKLTNKYDNIIEFDEFFNWGTVALIKSIEKFKPELGFTFLTYANWWITYFIRECIVNNDIIKIPRRHAELYIFERDKIKGTPLESNIRSHKVITSLEAYVKDSDSDDTTVADTVESDFNILDFYIEKIRKEIIGSSINRLKPRDSDIIKMRFGFAPYYIPHTLQEISDKHDLTREGVRIILQKSFKRLKDILIGANYD